MAYMDRVTRESTPCSLIRDLDSIGTPGSAVRSTCSAAAYQRRHHNSILRSIPSAQEIDDFFANAETQQQNQFTEKYVVFFICSSLFIQMTKRPYLNSSYVIAGTTLML